MFLNANDMVECPYNKTHRMLRKRLQSHLLKCRLSYPDVELRKCPFNITHLIPEPEYSYHATNCPDRKLITQYKYDAPEPKEEERPRHAPIECEENWDDTDVNDYNPKLYLESANVIRKPEGTKPSERKLFIKKERKRLGSADECSEEDETKYNAASTFPSDYYVTEEESANALAGSPRSYRKEIWDGESRIKRSTSSALSIGYAPCTENKRGRLSSPLGFRRSHRDQLPARSGSPDFSRHYFPPHDSIGRPSCSDPDYSGSSSNTASYSGRDPYYSDGNHAQSYYDVKVETQSEELQAPPPPMISYPTRHSYLNAKSSSRPSSNN